MILAHLSELHLGYRAYDRTEEGWNAREHDVALALARAIEAVVALAPDVVLIVGDVFDRPDPPPSALVTLTRALARLRTALPAVPVLLVAGARDTPRRVGRPGILDALEALPGVYTATSSTRSVLLEDLSLEVLLVPYAALLAEEAPLPAPDARVRYHVLAAHGRPATERGVAVDAAPWDYLALGGEHSHGSAGERASYPGSLERVGTEPWAEAAEAKGFLTVDLPSGRRTFHAVAGRAVVALAPIRVPTDPERVRRRIREVTDEVPGGIDDKIVRLRLQGLPQRDLVRLAGEPLGELRERALHLVVEADAAAPVALPDASQALTRLEERLARSGADTPARRELLSRLTVSDEAPR